MGAEASDRQGQRGRLAPGIAWLFAASALVLGAGCGTTSATRTLINESRPVVKRYEEMRARLAERGEAGCGSIKKGGCAVCAW